MTSVHICVSNGTGWEGFCEEDWPGNEKSGWVGGDDGVQPQRGGGGVKSESDCGDGWGWRESLADEVGWGQMAFVECGRVRRGLGLWVLWVEAQGGGLGYLNQGRIEERSKRSDQSFGRRWSHTSHVLH